METLTKVNINDVLFWMDAIRNSKDRFRVLESFWKGQINSKLWLIHELANILEKDIFYKIVIHGGWNGVLSSLLFNSAIKISKIESVDIDPNCEEVAHTINKLYQIEGKFIAKTCNMVDHIYDTDVVINTSCEHIDQSTYEKWLLNVPFNALIVLQSNNYFELDEHIRCSNSLDEFNDISNINLLYKGIFKTEKYDRYMLIGYK